MANACGWFRIPFDVAARRDLTPADKLVFGWVANAERCGRTPGTRSIAGALGIDRGTVTAAVRRLEAAGLLHVSHVRGRRSTYSAEGGTGGKTQPVEEPDWLEHPASTGRKAQPVPAGSSSHMKSKSFKRATAARPAGLNGGHLVKLWHDRHRDRTGAPYAGGKGKLAGTLKRLAGTLTPETVEGAIRRWFATDRGDFGVELFASRLAGGNRELIDRTPATSTDAAPDEYTRAFLAATQRETA